MSLAIVQAVLCLSIAYLCSRSSSVYSFAARAGVLQRPTLLGWFAALVLLGLALIQQYIKRKGWSVPITNVSAMRTTVPSVFLLIIGPVWEEIVTRGFLYRAFRGSYGPVFSTVIVICFSAVFHTSNILRSVVSATTFILGWVVFCGVRERSISIWNCVLGHAVYNAAVGHNFWLCLVEMIVFLPLCRFPKGGILGIWNEHQVLSPVNQSIQPTPR